MAKPKPIGGIKGAIHVLTNALWLIAQVGSNTEKI